MKLEFQAETIKTIPAAAGTGSTIYGAIHGLDWAAAAGAATVFYITLQSAYLLWKWYREYRDGPPKAP